MACTDSAPDHWSSSCGRCTGCPSGDSLVRCDLNGPISGGESRVDTRQGRNYHPLLDFVKKGTA